MQATGIVAEYNPFHNGHLHHVNETKKITQQPVIAVMSGSFMQRGELSILSKWQRASLAIHGGVDLVLELNCCATLRSAQYFASTAIALLAATGCVNTLSCGVENPQRDFNAAARLANSEAAQAQLRELLSAGSSYAAAWEKVLGEACALNTPNDILALEYTKAMLKTDIKAIYLQREDAGYNSTSLGTMASATAIRQALAQGDNSWQEAVPSATRAALKQQRAGYDEKLLWQLISHSLRTMDTDEIKNLCSCSEGLQNVLKAAGKASSLKEALALCSRKRYTTSRIRRLLMQLLLLTPYIRITEPEPTYIRPLAFNDTGRQLLKHMKKTASLPIITKVPKNSLDIYDDVPLDIQLELEERATNVWSMLQYDSSLNRPGNDYLISPVYIRN